MFVIKFIHIDMYCFILRIAWIRECLKNNYIIMWWIKINIITHILILDKFIINCSITCSSSKPISRITRCSIWISRTRSFRAKLMTCLAFTIIRKFSRCSTWLSSSSIKKISSWSRISFWICWSKACTALCVSKR